MIRDEESTETRSRAVMFGIGVVAAVLSAVAGVCSRVDPFPLISDGEGGFRLNPMEDRVLFAGVFMALASMVLAVFGKRVVRVVLIAIGLVLLVFNVAGWLGNHR